MSGATAEPRHVVLILDVATNEVVKRFEYDSERQAERAERGVNINLDHERFYTAIEEGEEAGDATDA